MNDIPHLDLSSVKQLLELIDIVKWACKKLKHQGDRDLSKIRSELLKIQPDITRVEAELKALELTGARPSREILWAREAVDSVRRERSIKRRAYEVRSNPPQKARAGKARKRKRRAVVPRPMRKNSTATKRRVVALW